MLREILSLPIIKKIKNLTYEISMFIYIDKNGNFVSFPDTERVGDSEKVDIAYLSDVVNNCKKIGSSQVILIHNHPEISISTGFKPIDFFLKLCKSSNVSPSKGDVFTTGAYLYDLQKNGITLVDHIIVNNKGYYSFKNNDMLK